MCSKSLKFDIKSPSMITLLQSCAAVAEVVSNKANKDRFILLTLIEQKQSIKTKVESIKPTV